uniref:Vta1 domain-containing protein n=1 Tax=Mesocestoides corti TaxID=53468 RepID=A0A5K3EUL5_MESCO
MVLATPPEPLKKFARICKIAQDYENTDPVITYYCRLYVASMGLKPEYNCKESRDFITKLLDFLTAAKKTNSEDPLYTEESVGLDYVQNKALDLFTLAFKKDESGDFGAATVNAFLVAGYLFEVLTLNGETKEEITNARKYAKFKVVHIIDCKKRGKQPTAGPLKEGDASSVPKIDGLSDNASLPESASHQPEHLSPKPAASTTDPAGKNFDLSTETCEKASKAAKFAISSLQYKDRDSAIEYLKQALSLLSSD